MLQGVGNKADQISESRPKSKVIVIIIKIIDELSQGDFIR